MRSTPPGVLLALALVACSPSEDVSPQVRDLLAATPAKLESLYAGDAHASQQFGSNIALLADELLVGAPGDSTGLVYRFRASGSGWEPAGTIAPPSEPGIRFGVGVAAAGDWLVVGAPGGDTIPGSAFVYQRSGGSWTFRQRLTVPKAEENKAWFGYSVGVGDGLVLVNAGLNYADARQGGVHVYRNVGGSFVWETELMPEDGTVSDQFGSGLSIDGDRLAIGAPNAFRGPGRAYLFRHDASGWHQEQKLTEGSANDIFGWSLWLRGDSLIVGAPSARSSAIVDGALFVYARGEAGWGRVQTLSDRKVESPLGSYLIGPLGYGVARDGDLLAATDTNHLLLWRLVNGQWQDVNWYMVGPGQGAGDHVCLSNGRLVAGNRLDKTKGSLAGAAYYTTVPALTPPVPDASPDSAPDTMPVVPPPPPPDAAPDRQPDLAPDLAPDLTAPPPDLGPPDAGVPFADSAPPAPDAAPLVPDAAPLGDLASAPEALPIADALAADASIPPASDAGSGAAPDASGSSSLTDGALADVSAPGEDAVTQPTGVGHGADGGAGSDGAVLSTGTGSCQCVMGRAPARVSSGGVAPLLLVLVLGFAARRTRRR